MGKTKISGTPAHGSKKWPFRLDDIDTAFPRDGSDVAEITFTNGTTRRTTTNCKPRDYTKMLGRGYVRMCYYRENTWDTILKIKSIQFLGTFYGGKIKPYDT